MELANILNIFTKILPYLSILLGAISFLFSAKLFEHHIERYKIFLQNFYIFLILFILDAILNYFLPQSFNFIYIFLAVFVAILYYIYLTTRRYGLLPIEVVVFINLVSWGLVLYSLVPILFAVTFYFGMSALVNLYILVILAILNFVFIVKNSLKLGTDVHEVIHILLGLILFVLLFVASFYNGQALYFNVHKWYFYSVFFVGVIEFLTHFPTIVHAPQFTGFKKWYWIIILGLLAFIL